MEPTLYLRRFPAVTRFATLGASTVARLAALAALLALASCSEQAADPAATPAEGGYTLLESIEATGDELLIPYKKYQLDNGLTVIIHEDHSDPLIHVDVTYHVGSAREEAQRSGFAHFFEHMMFQGSEHVADEEHIRTVSEAGGDMNGTTNEDRTNYFETVPSNLLERMLWLESDRMGFLLNAVTQEKFEVQRATVKNERGQNVENRPYGRFSEVNGAALFPPEHPYSWPVIGYPADLDAATLDDLKRFFLRWYGPNNATLTIGGDVDAAAVMAQVVQYFGEIPRGPEVAEASFPAPVLDADRYVSYVDENIRFPAVLFTWPTVALDHPDRVALEALNEIIGVGRKSFLYKQFILPRKAIEASGFNQNMELGGSLTFFVLPFPGTSLTQFEAELRQVISGFGADSISDEDLQIFKAGQEASLVRSLASVRGKVTQLAFNQTFLGNPNQIQKDLDDIRKLTKADVLRVFDTYVKGKPAVIQSVVPGTAPDSQAQPDNYTIPARLSRAVAEEAPLQLREVTSRFDRSLKPQAGPSPLVTMPSFWETTLPNGVEVIGTSSAEVPLVTLRLVFDGGRLNEEPSKFGLSALAAQMMNEGTQNYSAEQFENELQKLGSSLSVGADSDSTVVNVQTLANNLDATLVLLEERLFRSRFTEEDLQRLRQQAVESIQAEQQEPSGIAGTVWPRLLWGADHSFAVPGSGSIPTLEALTLADIESFVPDYLTADTLDVVVVGDLSAEQVAAKLAFLQNLPASGRSAREQPASPQLTGNTLYLIDKPQAAQSEVRVGYLSDVPYDPTGVYFERYLMNYVLGGAFNSRINLNLREDKGYTYGARSSFSAGRNRGGLFTASASVRADATADSVVQFIDEIRRYRDSGITAEELAFTQNSIGQSEALDYETPGQKAGLLQQIITYKLDADFVKRQQQIIGGLSTEQVGTLARTHLPLDNMQILVVGDKAVIGDSLSALGYPIVELDAEGKPR
jgi:zinc protease